MTQIAKTAKDEPAKNPVSHQNGFSVWKRRQAVECAGDLSVRVNGNDIDFKNMLCVPEWSENLLSSITKIGNRVSIVDNGYITTACYCA